MKKVSIFFITYYFIVLSFPLTNFTISAQDVTYYFQVMSKARNILKVSINHNFATFYVKIFQENQLLRLKGLLLSASED